MYQTRVAGLAVLAVRFYRMAKRAAAASNNIATNKEDKCYNNYGDEKRRPAKFSQEMEET
jgi:hypothetical protein